MSFFTSMASKRAAGWRAAAWPRAWPTVLRLALAARPKQAMRALWTVLRGKRVRGWNMLYLAAADHPSYYDRWVKLGEPRAIEAFCHDRQPVAMPSIGCIILDTGDAAGARRTLASLRKALPAETPVWTDIEALSHDGAVLIAPRTALASMLDGIQPQPDWLLSLKAGDLVSPALGNVLRHSMPDPIRHALVFWDEDRWHSGRREDPWIKPGWDPILFQVRNGVTGANLIAVQAIRHHADGAHFDAEGLARVTANVMAEDDVAPFHIPLILTHRANAAPFALQAEPPTSIRGTSATWPTVSIIIPTRDRASLLDTCLTGLARLAYPGAVELLIVDNDSVEPETHAVFERAQRDGARVLRHPGAFNFSALVNHAAAEASGKILCLLNNDIELLDGDWLNHMVRYAVRDDVGAAGARLLYPSGEIQHVGIAIGIGGAAGHVQKGVDPADPHFADWHAHSRIVSAVTGACLVVARNKFEAVGGLDAEGFAVDFNDVDFCLKLRALGLSNVLAVEATMVHQESKSRGTQRSPEGAARFERELELLRSRWHSESFQDPHYSPLFRRECERCVLAF